MPQKTGGAGNIQENYDPYTGKYVESPNSEIRERYGIKNTLTTKSKNHVPKMTSKATKRRFVSEMSDEELGKLIKDYDEIFGEDLDAIAEKAKEPTNLIKTYERMQFRQKQVDEEIEKQKKDRNIKYDNKCVIILGLPGSGKSTIADNFLLQYGAFEVDADLMKERIPEFQKDYQNVSKVHRESVDMSNDMLDKVINQNGNIVLGKVGGGDGEDLIKLVKRLNENGYEINVALNDLPIDMAISRTARRKMQKETTRIIPLHILLEGDENIHKNFDLLCDMDEISGGKMFSNDVPKGTTPKEIYSCKKGDNLKLWWNN